MTDLALPIHLDPDSAPDKTRYVTASDLPVRIYATDGGDDRPIHGAIYIGGEWLSRTWLPSGRYEMSAPEHRFDLRDRPKAKRGVWVAWWEPVNGAPDYATLHRTKGQALAKALRIESNLISLTYLEEGDGLDTPDTPADPPLWVEWK